VRILIAEDDRALLSVLARGLREQGYVLDTATRGDDALHLLRLYGYAAAIIDWRLPGLPGDEVIKQVRKLGIPTSVLMLTARDTTEDKVTGLDAGADDYLVKPFRLSELLAQVRSHLRRTGDAERSDEAVEAGEFKVDRAARRAWQDGRELSLRPKEFELLALLVAQAGRVVTRERIMDDVWQTEWMGSTRTLDTHILALRQKIGSDAITTLRGVGYRLELP